MSPGITLLATLLFARFFLFIFFQSQAALVLNSWSQSGYYWMLHAALSNIVCMGLLYYLLAREGTGYFRLFRFDKTTWRKDLQWFFLFSVLCAPVVFLPNYFLNLGLWGNMDDSFRLMFTPLPLATVITILILFPLTTALAELPLYFGYLKPRLQNHGLPVWLSILLPVLFLALQHAALPLLFDAKFFAYRAIVFLPFALFIGVTLHKRPALLPYLVIMHGTIDFIAALTLLRVSVLGMD